MLESQLIRAVSQDNHSKMKDKIKIIVNVTGSQKDHRVFILYFYTEIPRIFSEILRKGSVEDEVITKMLWFFSNLCFFMNEAHMKHLRLIEIMEKYILHKSFSVVVNVFWGVNNLLIERELLPTIRSTGLLEQMRVLIEEDSREELYEMFAWFCSIVF